MCIAVDQSFSSYQCLIWPTFVDVFFPFGKNTVRTNGGGTKEMLSIELITQWTNAKAIMNGGGDSTYKDFRPFTRVEIRRHIGLYILQGLAPSPQVEFKFMSHQQDPIHGNDMVSIAFGANAMKRHKTLVFPLPLAKTIQIGRSDH